MRYQIWVKADSPAYLVDANYHTIDPDGRLILSIVSAGEPIARPTAVFAEWSWFQIIREVQK